MAVLRIAPLPADIGTVLPADVVAALEAIEAAVHRSVATGDLDGGVLERCRVQVAALIGPSQAPVVAVPDIALPFVIVAEQFAVDVTGIDAAMLGPIRSALGDEGARTFVRAVLAIEQRERLAAAWPAIVDGARPPGEPAAAVGRRGSRAAPSLAVALHDFADAVMRMDALDPTTTEVVRLRCAHHHRCGT